MTKANISKMMAKKEEIVKGLTLSQKVIQEKLATKFKQNEPEN